MEILIIKTGGLGDVLRTTSILPGLRARYGPLRVTWLTARGSEELVAFHPLVDEVLQLDSLGTADVERVRRRLADRTWDRVLSFDDEAPLCELAAALGGDGADGRLSGAFARADGSLAYTPDTAPWFDMGLLSVHGRAEADRRKLANRATHPAIFAAMLGIEAGVPSLPLQPRAEAHAEEFWRAQGLEGRRPVIGLNTGAGGRWESKRLDVETTVAFVQLAAERLASTARPSFVLFGGPDEAGRNARILAGIGADAVVVDAGTGNSLQEFAALVGRLDLLLTSDSFGLHVAIAGEVPVVAFFAPTSPHEIELFGRGEKVVSTAPDAGSYRPDVDTASLTPERLVHAAERVLARAAGGDPSPSLDVR